MPLKHHSCVSAACDTCGEGWGEDGPWHFNTVEEVLNSLRRNEWIVVDARLTCPSCALQADCEATGHRYGEWAAESTHGVIFQLRICEHCGGFEYQPPFEQLQPVLQLAYAVDEIEVGPDFEGGSN
jgi:hypothetical protein